MNGIRMHERDLQPEEALAGLLVDEISTGSDELGERGVEVIHLVRNVVHTGAALGEKASDRCVLAERFEQFEAVLTDPKRGCPDTLVADGGLVLDFGSKKPLIGCKGRVEIFDGNSQVMNPPRPHRTDATRT
jgi:hypothetical protein